MVKNICLLAFMMVLSLSFTTAHGAQLDDRTYALFGQIVSIDSTTITVKLSNDTEQVAIVTGETALIRDRRSASLNDFREGDQVIVVGARNESGQIVAQRIFGGEIPINPDEWSGGLQSILTQIAGQLALTDAQKEQIKQILNSARPRIQPLLLQLAMAEIAMRTATRNGTFNVMQVRLIATRQGQIIGNLIVEKERIISEIYNILTPEQQAKFNQLQGRFLEILIESFTIKSRATNGKG